MDSTESGRPGPSHPGELLRVWRMRALLTQEELAMLAGLGVRTIRRLECGARRRPRAASVRLVADALALPAADRAMLIATLSGHDPDKEAA